MTTQLAPKTYPIAPNGIFWSLQGEAHLRGFQMAFLRLSGCDVACDECDTDYSIGERLTVEDVADRLRALTPGNMKDPWVWITGGEPTVHDLRPLYVELRKYGFSIALATSGNHRAIAPVDWLSVSYHGGYPLLQRYGNELKVVEGLNGLNLSQFIVEYPDDTTDFMYRYVQPLWDMENDRECSKSLRRCLAFLKDNPNWSLSRQDHKFWGQD